ncbi:MAG: hotdog domain-containing protein [Lentimicrobiaceae bacterium]
MDAETRQVRVVFPNNVNEHNTLFGGTAMQWMDEVAYITAIRLTRNRMVTVSVEKIKFKLPVKPGTIAEIIGKVIKVKPYKVEVQVEIFAEEMFFDKREKAVEALFTFAAVDDSNKPIPIKIQTACKDFINA